MKNHIFTLALSICFLILSNDTVAQTPVTFNVNMLAIGMSDNLHVVGNFADPNYDNVMENPDYQNWTPSASSGLMTDNDMDLVYTATLMLQPGLYEFKFVNGIDWPNAETVPATCTVEVNGNSNRQIMVGTSATSYSVCYGECADCGENAIRLRVDMSTVDLDADGIGGELGEDIHPEGVFVNGSYASWVVFTPLQDWNGDNIWEGLITTYSADPIEFKFINGPAWDFPSETVMGSCGLGNSNRYLLINETNTVLPVYCWSSCDPCTQPSAVTFQVDMNTACEDTSPGIYLMGTLTDWASGTPMSDADGDGIWTLTLQLNTGNYDFKYRIGDSGWEGIGVRQLIVVGDTPLNLPVVCFNSSQACNPLVDPSTVTFNVDVSNIPMSNGEVLWVMGDFTTPAWQSGAIQMSDTNGDDIWSVTVPNVCPTYLKYKYRIGYPQGSFFTEEDANFSAIGGCGVDNGGFSDNRFLERTSASPISICNSFNSCQICSFQSIPGCTDPTACNYNPAATSDDGSCNYDCPPCDSGNGTDIIWLDDFSNPQSWIIAHDGTFNSDFEIGQGLESTGAYGTPAILSTTAANGYALYNSDGYNNSAGVAYEQPHITTSTPIDLSGYSNVILEFETQYRRFTDEQTWLIISTDGTFPMLDDPTMDISGLPGVYRVWEDGELTQSVSPGNPTIKSFNISEVAANSPQVWVRFQFTGIWGYAWYIDDVQIRQQFEYDANLTSARMDFSSTLIEYGRIPVELVPNSFTINSSFSNSGAQPLSNVGLELNIIETNSNTSVYSDFIYTASTLLPGAEVSFNQDIALGALPIGNYEAFFNIQSTEQSCDLNTTNNIQRKKFQVTADEFGLDSYELYAPGEELIGSLGSNSFTDNFDGLMAMSYYELESEATIYGLDIYLAGGTVAGGQIIAEIHDTLNIFFDIVDSPILTSQPYTITELDVTNGRAFIPFEFPTTLSPNGYYASATLYSNGDSSPIRILDAFTVTQPTYGSLIYLPSDGLVYSNGNAFGIRMILSPSAQIFGCTNPSACNYDPAATINDNSCLQIGSVCNDNNASTNNDIIQSNCECVGTPIDVGCAGYSVGNTTTNPTCAGLSNGAITLNTIGNSGPFVYDWSNGALSPSINNLSAGIYSVAVTDAVGCTEQLSFTITEPAPLSASSSTSPVSCFGAITGSASVLVSGGTGSYNYAWNTSPIQFTQQISNVAAGTYTVVITDENGCMLNSNVTITQPEQPLVVSATSTPASCSQNDGSASASVIGNTGNTQYQWSNGQTGSVATNLVAGTYTITATSGGCSAETTVSVNNINAPVITQVSSSPACFGDNTGSINTIVTGGTQPYQFLWSNGGSGTSQNALTAGNYTFIVLDNVGCQASVFVTLTQPDPINISLLPTSTACGETPQGAVNSIVSGGVSPYMFNWSNGASGSLINNLEAGQYGLTITDANGCVAESFTEVTNPDGVSAYAIVSDVACIGEAAGSIEVVVTEGTPPFNFEWSDGTSNSSQLNNLLVGDYSCTITDANGCTYSLTETIEGPQGNLPDILGFSIVDPFSIQTYSVAPIVGASFTWLVSGGNILTGQGSNFIEVQWSNDSPATIVLIILYPDGCQSTLNLDIEIGTFVSENSTDIHWSLYPNPAQENIVIDVQSSHQPIWFRITDIGGREIMNGRLLEGTNNLNLSSFAGGLYTIEVYEDSARHARQRFIKK
jgi:hypothetical protein